MKGYCPRCEEIRTDSGDDAWGFVWHAAVPQCQRCGSVVELSEDSKQNELDLSDEEEVIDES